MMIEMEPNTIRRFSLKIGTVSMGFTQRPVSTPAPEGTIAFLDGRSEKGNHCRGVGVYRDGEWKGGKGGSKLRFVPLTWSTADAMEPGNG